MSSPRDYFSSDYFSARNRFREAIEKRGGRLDVLPIDARGPGGEELTIDIGWIGSPNPARVLLHSSGVHGVEGFAGSAIQLALLDQLPQTGPDTALVFAHILNPYGMSWLRRVNENNVDLNRNFREGLPHEGAPALYPRLDPIINPPSPPARDYFLWQAAWMIVRYGFNGIKDATAGGQCQFPRGLFFGGKQLEQGPVRYRAYLAERMAGVRGAVAIDVHTALGKYGVDVLLVRPAVQKFSRLRNLLGARVTPLEAQGGPAFRVFGSIFDMLENVLPRESYIMAQEFGTYSPVKVLHAMREENRWHQFGSASLDHPVKQRMKDAFYPPHDDWRAAIIKRGLELYSQCLTLLECDSVPA